MRACTVCGRPSTSSRCERHRKRQAYGTSEYRRNRRAVLAASAVCWLCGNPGTEDDPLTADHVLSVDDGGTDAAQNLRPAHRSCNSRRGQRQQEVWDVG